MMTITNSVQLTQFQDKNYQVMNGTWYHEETPQPVIAWLEKARANKQRVRMFLGDAITGRDWMEENDTIGTIGRSTGTVQIPLLIKSARSWGGGGILTDCIVKLMVQDAAGKYVEVWKHHNYHQAEMKLSPSIMEGYAYDLQYAKNYIVGEGGKMIPEFQTYARFTSYEKAVRFMEFIEGKRHSK